MPGIFRMSVFIGVQFYHKFRYKEEVTKQQASKQACPMPVVVVWVLSGKKICVLTSQYWLVDIIGTWLYNRDLNEGVAECSD